MDLRGDGTLLALRAAAQRAGVCDRASRVSQNPHDGESGLFSQKVEIDKTIGACPEDELASGSALRDMVRHSWRNETSNPRHSDGGVPFGPPESQGRPRWDGSGYPVSTFLDSTGAVLARSDASSTGMLDLEIECPCLPGSQTERDGLPGVSIYGHGRLALRLIQSRDGNDPVVTCFDTRRD